MGFLLMGRAMLSKPLIQFSVDGWVCVPPCCLTWDQTMVEVMKIMATSFKSSHVCTATLSAPDPAAGHCRPTPLWETSGLSCASLAPSLVGLLLLFPGSWCTQAFVCALQESVSPPRAPAPAAVHWWPTPLQETLKHSSGSASVGTLGPGAHKVWLSPLSVFGGYGVWF